MTTETRPALIDERLAEIQARVKGATPGPWGVYEAGGGLIEIAADLDETGYGYRARRGIARLEEEPLDNDPSHRDWTAEEDWDQVQADADFIAHAPEDLRALLTEVHTLRARISRARSLDALKGKQGDPEPDPIAYGPTSYRCGCGKIAHSNLVPCQPDEAAADKDESQTRATTPSERDVRYATYQRWATGPLMSRDEWEKRQDLIAEQSRTDAVRANRRQGDQ